MYLHILMFFSCNGLDIPCHVNHERWSLIWNLCLWKAFMVRHNFSIWHCTSVLYASFLHILYVSGHINWTMYGSIQFTWLQNQMLLLYLFGCTVFKWVKFILEFFHQYIFRNLSILVFSSVPRFFHYEYTHGNSTFVTTSLSRDKSYNQFWHAWQSLTSTFIPFTALGCWAP